VNPRYVIFCSHQPDRVKILSQMNKQGDTREHATTGGEHDKRDYSATPKDYPHRVQNLDKGQDGDTADQAVSVQVGGGNALTAITLTIYKWLAGRSNML
jgi:hypothetical protein